MTHDFLGQAKNAKNAANTNGHPPTPYQPQPGDDTRAHAYAATALQNECDIVAATPEGQRNDQLNTSVFKVARFVAENLLTELEVIDAFTYAGHSSGLDSVEIGNTIRSALAGRSSKPPTQPLIPPPSQASPPPASTNDIGDEPTDDEQRDLHQIAVHRKAYELQLADEARALWATQRAALMGQQPPEMVSMTAFLATPDEDATYRVANLLPVGGRALLAAQYKAGKTSMIANLLRSLVDGDLFLGCYHTEPLQRILLIDTELDERMLRRWLRQQNIRNPDAINVLCLRGKLSTFNIVDDRTRAQWAKTINGAQLVILDCLRPCLDALGLSEDKEAGVFLTAFDALCKECGADEAVVVHHMGHNSERSRGDSRLLDWPDVLWKIIRETDDNDNDDDAGDRFFSAVGRDVLIPEAQLLWEPESRALSICGGGRNAKKARGVVDDIAEIMADPANAAGLSQTQLVNKLKGYSVGRNIARLAIRQAVDNLMLLVATGPRESKIHTLNPSWRRFED